MVLGFSRSPVTQKGNCHRLSSRMEGVPQPRSTPALGVRDKSPLIKQRVYHGSGDPREREEVSQVQRVQEMERTRCRVSHRAQHAQEGDSRGGCPACTWLRPAAAPCGGGAAEGPRGRRRGRSRRCARTARGRGRGRRARPATAARTPAPWRRHGPGRGPGTPEAAMPARKERLPQSGAGRPGLQVMIGQGTGAARADWWAKAGGRGKGAGLGLGGGGVPS